MLYYIFTVDGDWREYFNTRLSKQKRFPKKRHIEQLIKREITFAKRYLDGRIMHFIHTSPCASTFFLKEPFMGLWKEITNTGGDIGIHCHEDDPDKAYYFRDVSRMRQVISQQVKVLRKNGLEVRAYRGGYLAFNADLIKVLEENELEFDFSCEPGRYLVFNGQIVSDWRGVPVSLYRMDYSDHRKKGASRVFEVPIGMANGHYLYFEKSSLEDLEQVASDLKKISQQESYNVIVSVLTHSYEFSSKRVEEIERKSAILKKYGRFINLKEVDSLI